jgi:hypothetical protein
MDGQVKSMKGNVKWVLILGVKRVSLSLSPSLQKMSAENECRCEDSCVCTVLLHGIGCFPSFLKPVLCTVLTEGTSKPIARKSTPQSSSVLNASES